MKPEQVDVKAFCKINLTLDIEGRRPDGYHTVRMLLQTIPLHDVVSVRRGDRRAAGAAEKCAVRISSDADWLPLNEKNTAYRAASALIRDYGDQIDADTEFFIEKRVPPCGGLGGSSTDAAAVLNGMNRLYELGLSYEQLASYAAKIGADVPFLLKNGAAEASGTGTTLRYLTPFRNGILLLVNPHIEIATPEAYRLYDFLEERGEIPPEAHPDPHAAEEAMKGSVTELGSAMKNVLEYPAFYRYPALRELKRELLEAGATAALMSGSGATFYGIFRPEDAEQAARAAAEFDRKGFFTFVSEMSV